MSDNCNMREPSTVDNNNDETGENGAASSPAWEMRWLRKILFEDSTDENDVEPGRIFCKRTRSDVEKPGGYVQLESENNELLSDRNSVDGFDDTDSAPEFPTPPSTYDAFILYNGCSQTGYDVLADDQDDKKLAFKFAKYITEVIEGDDRHVYFPHRDCLPGRCVFDALEEAVERSLTTLVVMTPGFHVNQWSCYSQKFAFSEYLDTNTAWRLIPVCVGISGVQVPRCLKNQQKLYFSLERWDDQPELVDKLLEAIQRSVNEIQRGTSQAPSPGSPPPPYQPYSQPQMPSRSVSETPVTPSDGHTITNEGQKSFLRCVREKLGNIVGAVGSEEQTPSNLSSSISIESTYKKSLNQSKYQQQLLISASATLVKLLLWNINRPDQPAIINQHRQFIQLQTHTADNEHKQLQTRTADNEHKQLQTRFQAE